VTVQIPTLPAPSAQASYFAARPVEVREPAARSVTRTAISSSREALENRDERNNRSEQTTANRETDIRVARSAPRGGRGENLDIEA
jgi:hypothetical protein